MIKLNIRFFLFILPFNMHLELQPKKKNVYLLQILISLERGCFGHCNLVNLKFNFLRKFVCMKNDSLREMDGRGHF